MKTNRLEALDLLAKWASEKNSLRFEMKSFLIVVSATCTLAAIEERSLRLTTTSGEISVFFPPDCTFDFCTPEDMGFRELADRIGETLLVALPGKVDSFSLSVLR